MTGQFRKGPGNPVHFLGEPTQSGIVGIGSHIGNAQAGFTTPGQGQRRHAVNKIGFAKKCNRPGVQACCDTIEQGKGRRDNHRPIVTHGNIAQQVKQPICDRPMIDAQIDDNGIACSLSVEPIHRILKP